MTLSLLVVVEAASTSCTYNNKNQNNPNPSIGGWCIRCLNSCWNLEVNFVCTLLMLVECDGNGGVVSINIVLIATDWEWICIRNWTSFVWQCSINIWTRAWLSHIEKWGDWVWINDNLVSGIFIEDSWRCNASILSLWGCVKACGSEFKWVSYNGWAVRYCCACSCDIDSIAWWYAWCSSSICIVGCSICDGIIFGDWSYIWIYLSNGTIFDRSSSGFEEANILKRIIKWSIKCHSFSRRISLVSRINVHCCLCLNWSTAGAERQFLDGVGRCGCSVGWGGFANVAFWCCLDPSSNTSKIRIICCVIGCTNLGKGCIFNIATTNTSFPGGSIIDQFETPVMG